MMMCWIWCQVVLMMLCWIWCCVEYWNYSDFSKHHNVLHRGDICTWKQTSQFLQKIRRWYLALVPDLTAATDFLSVLNDAHPAIQFTMETAVNNKLLFIGMVITKTDNHLNTSVYRKKTNKGLLLHYQSHMDNRYKRSLIRTVLDRAKRLSSLPYLFSKECYDLKKMFLKLKYPVKLMDYLYNNQINARALIGQLAVDYCYYKRTEKSRVFWIII